MVYFAGHEKKRIPNLFKHNEIILSTYYVSSAMVTMSAINTHVATVRNSYYYYLFNRWGKWGIKLLTALSEFTQLIKARANVQIYVCVMPPVLSFYHLCSRAGDKYL